MVSGVYRQLSQVVAVVLVAVGGSAAVAGCASGTADASTAGSSLSSAPSGSTAPTGGGGTPPTPPATNPTEYDTVAPARSGGSAVEVETPCDQGTLAVSAYPDGGGVGMTATLRHTAHRTWGYSTGITPQVDSQDLPTLIHATAREGVVMIHDNNLTGPGAVTGAKRLSRAWPQSAGLVLYAGSQTQCGASVYLSARHALGATDAVHLLVLRSGAVGVFDGHLAVRGTWKVSVTARTPTGVQHATRAVSAQKRGYPAPFYLQTRVQGFNDLRDFTKVTVTIAKEGQPSTWMTLTRTP